MALARKNFAVLDLDNMTVVDGATIRVRRHQAGMPLAALKSNRAGTTGMDNPYVAADGANAGFFVIGGAYEITATKDGFSRTWEYEAVGTSQETDLGAQFNDLGAYSALTVYARWDLVVYNGSSYVYINDTPASGNAPPASGVASNAYWQLIALAGSPGGPITIPYTFSITTADADPGAGVLRLGSATQNASTVIRADLLDNLGNTWTGVLDTFAASTSAIKGFIRIGHEFDETKWLLFSVSALATPSGYRNITVANVGFSAASPFANGDPVLLEFIRNGDKGDQGIQGIQGPAYNCTSLTSITIGTGVQSFTVGAGLAWQIGARARASYSADRSKWLEGLVSDYTGGVLTIDADLTNSSGTFADWKINIAGERGAAGSPGAGTGDVVGPSGAGNWERAAFNTTTGKLIRAGNVVDQIDRVASVPTLDLGDEDLAATVILTRASTATYFDLDGLLKTAAANVARFEYDPVTRQPRGLLYESAATNQLFRSQEFDNAYWTRTNLLAFGSGSVANTVAAPDGTVTAEKITEDTATGAHTIGSSNVTAVNKNVQQTFSVFLKAAGRTAARLVISAFAGDTITADFNLTAGSVTAQANSGTGSGAAGRIEACGDGWYRCALSGVPSTTAATTVACSISLGNGVSFSSYTGDGTSGLYVWGAQLEAGAHVNYPTSYIPTTSAAASRSADSPRIVADSSWFNSAEGTLFIDMTPIGVQSGSGVEQFGLDDGSTNNHFRFRYGVILGGAFDVTANSAAVNQADLGQLAVVALTRTRIALAYALNDLVFTKDGTTIAGALIDTSVALPVGINRLSLGLNGGGAHRIHRVIYWPKRLSNAQVQLLTAA